MAGGLDPVHISRDAQKWYNDAYETYTSARDKSPERMAAITAMASAAMARLAADNTGSQ